ncbi:unknown protein [Seminavis robusta]|uniref:Uncharacterized protein n=1 Tax=Seminavis robusta TaxID=568900 RepID=A0A9N8F3S4_9STRA|nr:unknown protein [Seminavis robusta]|eukprot:Sro3225_g345590.1 n/a (338) ;mRNA; r:4795-5808
MSTLRVSLLSVVLLVCSSWSVQSSSFSDNHYQAYQAPRLRLSQSEKLKRRRLFDRYLHLKAQRIPAAFATDLQQGGILYHSSLDVNVTSATGNSASYEKAPASGLVEDGKACHVQCSLGYKLTRLRGLESATPSPQVAQSATQATTNSTREPGITIQVQPVQQEQRSGGLLATTTAGNNLWKIQLVLHSFQADMTAQLNGKVCNQRRARADVDFTSYGSVTVENAVVTATLSLQGGPNLHQPHIIDLVDFDDHHWTVDKSNPTFQKLLHKIPQHLVEQSVQDFIHYIFTERLQAVMEQQLTATATATPVDPASPTTSSDDLLLPVLEAQRQPLQLLQ